MPGDSAEIYRPGILGSRKEDNQCQVRGIRSNEIDLREGAKLRSK